MLEKLEIRNYAIINHVEIPFHNGLTVITGETGAGKSILLGALGLVLGNRADLSMLHANGQKCVVEAKFRLDRNEWQSFFDENDLDNEEVTIIRREISPSGRSRAFINDTPVTLDLLQGLSGGLVQIHSQHETLDLANSAFQLKVIDSLARNDKLLGDYRRGLTQLMALKKELEELLLQHEQALKDEDYAKFQLEELDNARLDELAIEELEQELSQLEHAGEIRQQVTHIESILDGEEGSIDRYLQDVRSLLDKLSAYYSPAEALEKRLHQAAIEISDVLGELQKGTVDILPDPAREEEISDQLSAVYHLYRKHSCQTPQELIAIREDYRSQLDRIVFAEEDINKLEKDISDLEGILHEKAMTLHKLRLDVIPGLGKEVQKLLAQTGMPSGELKVGLELTDELLDNGRDRIRFDFSANKGAPAREISKVASGGELSRLMLVIKSLLAANTSLPTLLFDEIDTGISGKVAAMVGEIMKDLSKRHQVITITHLPQIAGTGDEHLLVYKEESEGKDHTSIRKLNEEERVDTIASMLSGATTASAARENARSLLDQS